MMKNYLTYFFFFILYYVDGQNINLFETNCIIKENQNMVKSEVYSVNTNCSHTSSYWSNNNLYYPDAEDDFIYMKLNFIFLTKPDGTGNFEENNPEHIQVIDDIIDGFNMRLSTLFNSQNCNNNGQNFIPNSKIQVIVNKIWKIDPAWDYLYTGFIPSNGPLGGNAPLYPPSNNYYYSYLDYDTSIPNGINIVFANNGSIYEDLVVNQNYDNYNDGIGGAHGGQQWAASEFPTTELDNPSRQFYPDVFNKYIWMKEVAPSIVGQPWEIVREWFISIGYKTFPHELGHTLWLIHEYCTDHVMNPNWSSPQTFLSPNNLGLEHRATSITNIRKYFTEDSYTNSKIEINNDELWDLDMRIYSDVEIGNNSSLKETCNLITPPQSKIVVKNGSNFVIEGGYVNSANNYSWEGIKVEGLGYCLILPDTEIDNGHFYAYTDNSLESRLINPQLKSENVKQNTTSLKDNIKVYPNPFKDFLKLDINKNSEFYYVKIYDNFGICVYSGIINSEIDNVDTTNFKSGIYYLNIENNNLSIKKILIKN